MPIFVMERPPRIAFDLFALPFFLLAVLPAGSRAPKVPGRVTPWMLTTGALALCALFALVSARESAFWADAEMGKSIVGYEKYLARWPKGRHVDDARLRIADLERQKAGLAARKTEREAWLETVKNADNEAGFAALINANRLKGLIGVSGVCNGIRVETLWQRK